MYHVYILRCRDNSFYIGHTGDLNARLEAHNAGHGAAHTFKHRPVELIYFETYPSRLTAIRRERQLKKWTRKKKEALIRGDLETLRSLSRRRAQGDHDR
jgi:tRNA/rRNA methyltransferase